jgi:hypothetical protein
MITKITNKILNSIDSYIDSKKIENRYNSYQKIPENVDNFFMRFYMDVNHVDYLVIKHTDINYLDDILFSNKALKVKFEEFKSFCTQLLYGNNNKTNTHMILLEYSPTTKEIISVKCQWNESGIWIECYEDNVMLSVNNGNLRWKTRNYNCNNINNYLQDMLDEMKGILISKAGYALNAEYTEEFKTFKNKSTIEVANEKFSTKKYNYKSQEELVEIVNKKLTSDFVKVGIFTFKDDHEKKVLTIFDELIKSNNERHLMRQLMSLMMFYFKIKNQSPTIYFDYSNVEGKVNKLQKLDGIFYVYCFDKLLELFIGKDKHTFTYKSPLKDEKYEKTSETLNDVYIYLLESIREDINKTLMNGNNTITLNHLKVYEMINI